MSLARVFPRFDNLDATVVECLRSRAPQWDLYRWSKKGRDLCMGYGMVGTICFIAAALIPAIAPVCALIGICMSFRLLNRVRMAILLYEAAGIP